MREGGLRIGFVKTIRTVRLPSGKAGAEMAVTVQGSAGDLPVDTSFTIRPRSPARPEVPGDGARLLDPGGAATGTCSGSRRPRSRFRSTTSPGSSTARRASGIQRNIQGFGNALAGRGQALNSSLGELPRLLGHVAPVTRNLSDRRTRHRPPAARAARRRAHRGARWPRPRRTSSPGRRITFEAISSDTDALKETISRSHPALQAGIESFPVQRPFLTDSAALAREMQPVARDLRPALPEVNDALETGIPVTRRSVRFYDDLQPALVSLRELARDPATGIALRGLTANATTLQPQLRFLGPYQTVCNYWNYFWTFLGEHVSQRGPVGYLQRATIKSTGQQSQQPQLDGRRGARATARATARPPRRRGAPVHLHGQSYTPAIGPGRPGRLRERPARLHPAPLALQPTPSSRSSPTRRSPACQGPTYKGRPRVPRGQSLRVTVPRPGRSIER